MGPYTVEKYLTIGKKDIAKMNPFTPAMPDNHCWAVSQKRTEGVGIGKKYKRVKGLNYIRGGKYGRTNKSNQRG